MSIYKVSILEKFINLEQTQNEISQQLEQLRAMDENISIDVILANSSPIGWSTPSGQYFLPLHSSYDFIAS